MIYNFFEIRNTNITRTKLIKIGQISFERIQDLKKKGGIKTTFIFIKALI